MMEILLLLFFFISLLKKNYALSLVIIVMTQNGYLWGGEYFYGYNFSDVGLLLLLLLFICLRCRRYSNNINIDYLKVGVKIFFAIFFVDILVDVLINHTSIISQIKAIRSCLPILLLGVVNRIKPEEGKEVFRYLVLITFVFSSIYVFEYFTDFSITGARRAIISAENTGRRATLIWYLGQLCFALLIQGKLDFSKQYRLLFFCALGLNIIVAASISFFLSYVFIGLLYFISTKFSVKKILSSVFVLLALILVISTDNVLSERINVSSQDVQESSAGKRGVTGTFSFRMLMFQERLNYVTSSLQYSLFGMGNIEEKNVKNRIFTIGLLNEDNEIIQYDTADITWAPALVRWGVLGTLIYIMFFYCRFLFFYRKRKESPYANAMYMFLLTTLLITSWTGNYMPMNFWIIPIFCIPATKLIESKVGTKVI